MVFKVVFTAWVLESDACFSAAARIKSLTDRGRRLTLVMAYALPRHTRVRIPSVDQDYNAIRGWKPTFGSPVIVETNVPEYRWGTLHDLYGTWRCRLN